MNRINKLAIATMAAALAFTSAAARAEDQPSGKDAAQPAAASQPAAAAQPNADQRLQDLEKEVALLQQEIAALKEDSTPGLKTAALVQPDAASAGITPNAPADEAPKINLAGLLGPVTLSGFGDAYYGYDPNHPFNNQAGLRSFEGPTNGFNFNLAELILDKPPDAMSAEGRLGYHVSAGYGYAAKIVNGSDNTGFGDGSNFFLKEAYLSYLAPVGKGLTITVGKFVTPMGAEVIESNANWNYSRGLLFDYAIPFFHFGANAKYAFNSKWAVTGYLVNGWNNTIINHFGVIGGSSGLTYGASLAFTPNMKWSVTENYFAGPVLGAYAESTGASLNDWKQISDTVIAYTPNTKWAFELNGDYGFGPRYYPVCDDSVVKPQVFISCGTPSQASTWWGVASYAKYTWTPKTNFAVRYEYYDDPQGYTGLVFGDRGWAQEVTGTYSYNVTSAFLLRAEYRYDFASEPIFGQSFSNEKFVKEQNTATLGFVYTFSSANLK
jgi:Putative beta-barrel porin-2, OmpL-like. bbp2